MGIKENIHEKIVDKLSLLKDWTCRCEDGLVIPFYTSFDIRDSGFKVATVDANIFPAGFNNICDADRDYAQDMARVYLDKTYGANTKKILLLTEEHTQNPYYWENVNALREILEGSGRAVRVAFPREDISPFFAESVSGKKIQVFAAKRVNGHIDADGFVPDLIISNNDFSQAYGQWSEGLNTPINPPREMGWYRRKKSDFFREYNKVAIEFSKLIDVDPWLLSVDTEVFTGFDIEDESRVQDLANSVERSLKRIGEKYLDFGIKERPFVYIKNNSGTYGLGVMQVNSGAEVLELNYKSRKKMKAAKGGREISEVVIQEGIATSVFSDGVTAEPAIYLIGCNLAGGFLRTHKEKGSHDNLNAPGALYKKLCVSDLEVNVQGRLLENVYGWVAKLGLLAIGREYQAYRDGISL